MRRQTWTLLAVMLGIFMLLLDVTIVVVALPDIGTSLGASFADLQWTIDAYALSLASLLLVSGSLADSFGRRRLFAIGLSLQSTGSMVDRPVARERLDAAVDDIDATIRDIRRSIFALGSGDEAADIQAEVTRMVDRAAATLKFRPALRFDGPVRALVGAEIAPELLAARLDRVARPV